jgi:hypothetical protein
MLAAGMPGIPPGIQHQQQQAQQQQQQQQAQQQHHQQQQQCSMLKRHFDGSDRPFVKMKACRIYESAEIEAQQQEKSPTSAWDPPDQHWANEVGNEGKGHGKDKGTGKGKGEGKGEGKGMAQTRNPSLRMDGAAVSPARLDKGSMYKKMLQKKGFLAEGNAQHEQHEQDTGTSNTTPGPGAPERAPTWQGPRVRSPSMSEEVSRRALDDLIGRNVRETARSRWLANEEVFDLLHNFRAYGLHESTVVLPNPPSKRPLLFISRCLSRYHSTCFCRWNYRHLQQDGNQEFPQRLCGVENKERDQVGA